MIQKVVYTELGCAQEAVHPAKSFSGRACLPCGRGECHQGRDWSGVCRAESGPHGLYAVHSCKRPAPVPGEPIFRTIEGWILGQALP